MWDKYLSGYYYEIKSDYMEDTFIVSIDDNFNYINADYFLPVYYSQKYNLNYSLRQNKILSKLKWKKITDLNHKLN